MLHDARKVSDGEVLSCDICIVGAGAAGIALAMELSASGRRVLLLEAGGMHRSGKSQELYRGEVADPDRHLPLDSDRYRQFGGTTGLWGGRCIPYDPIDFECRAYVPHSGWPILFDDLVPFYERAHRYCECGQFEYQSEVALPQAEAEMISGLRQGGLVTSCIERWSPPTHFGKLGRSLTRCAGVHVYLHAIVTKLDVSADGSRVSGVEVRTFKGTRFSVRADQVVLAGGGLEVTRLLMVSNAVHVAGIGNHAGWLGKGYMCHINGVIARAVFDESVNVVFGYEVDTDGVYCRRRIMISEDAQRQREVLNVHFLLDRPLLEDPEHASSMLSLTFLAKAFSQKHSRDRQIKGKYGLYWRHVRNILAGSPEMFMVLPKWCRSRFMHGRRIPSMLTRGKGNAYHLYYHTEQTPSRDSVVRLCAECDALGTPRLLVDYRIAERDVESICRAHALIDEELRASGVGRLDYTCEDPKSEIRSHQATLGHHIGTTRMSSDPTGGVVDANCKVHQIENLYVSSSSVFPTSSQANPTLTIVAMAIRLAEHLQTRDA